MEMAHYSGGRPPCISSSPILVSCIQDDDSGIRLIPTKTRRSALRFENSKAARIDGELRRGAAATCSQSFVDLHGGKELAPGIYSGRVLIFTGDSRGAIQSFDVQDALRRLGVEAIPSGQVKWRRQATIRDGSCRGTRVV